MKELAKFPILRILKLYGDLHQDEDDDEDHLYATSIHVIADSFPQLQVLQLNDLFRIEEWRQERSAMPSLRHLLFRRCFQSNIGYKPTMLRELQTELGLTIHNFDPRHLSDCLRAGIPSFPFSSIFIRIRLSLHLLKK